MITVQGKEVEIFKFPGGEINIRLPKGIKSSLEIKVIARLQSSDMIMALLLVMDALKRNFVSNANFNITIPYLPYARQDRVCNYGESLSKEVMLKLLSLTDPYPKIIYDEHSEWNSPYITNVAIKKILEKFKGNLNKNGDLVILIPDEGATDKLKHVVQMFGCDYTQAHKVRDPETGMLSGFTIDNISQLEDKHVLICDDICDGGGTFLGLANVVRSVVQIKTLSLYVTHGIFSKGTKELKQHFNNIYTTDSWYHETPLEGVTTLNIIGK